MAMIKPDGTDEPLRHWYVTFGQKYRYEPHPQGGHPDGYFVIEAVNEAEARAKAFATFGKAWANMYEGTPASRYAPLGELGRIL